MDIDMKDVPVDSLVPAALKDWNPPAGTKVGHTRPLLPVRRALNSAGPADVHDSFPPIFLVCTRLCCTHARHMAPNPQPFTLQPPHTPHPKCTLHRLATISFSNPDGLYAQVGDAFVAEMKAYDEEKASQIKAAADKGMVLRYVGVVDLMAKKAKVTLAEYPNTHPFAGTQYADNICAFGTERYVPQPLVIQGPGAGAAVTAAGVYADIIRIAKSC